jgi:hypothetical protein
MTAHLTDEQLREWRTWLSGLMRWPPCDPQMIIALIDELLPSRDGIKTESAALEWINERDRICARIRDAALDEAARVMRGIPVDPTNWKCRYRTWPQIGDGDRSNDSEITKHCDALADAVLALKTPEREDG